MLPAWFGGRRRRPFFWVGYNGSSLCFYRRWHDRRFFCSFTDGNVTGIPYHLCRYRNGDALADGSLRRLLLVDQKAHLPRIEQKMGGGDGDSIRGRRGIRYRLVVRVGAAVAKVYGICGKHHWHAVLA